MAYSPASKWIRLPRLRETGISEATLKDNCSEGMKLAPHYDDSSLGEAGSIFICKARLGLRADQS